MLKINFKKYYFKKETIITIPNILLIFVNIFVGEFYGYGERDQSVLIIYLIIRNLQTQNKY